MKKRILIALVVVLALAATASLVWANMGGLVSYWPFEGTAFDAVDANHGTVNGATYVAGKFGQALSFDGNDYVEVPGSASMNVSGGYTFVAWVYLLDTDQYRGFFRRGGLGVAASQIEIYTQPTSHGRELTVVHNRGGSFAYKYFTAFPLNQWVHLVVTWDGTSLKAYYNNSEQGVTGGTPMVSPATSDPPKPNYIGVGYYNAYMNGIIDEVGIWNRALTPEEIAALSVGVGSLEWLPPITLPDWTLNENATLPIKFQLYDAIGDLICTDVGPTLQVNSSGISDLRFHSDSECYYIANFRPTNSGGHTAVVSLDGVELGSQGFEVVEPGRANGRGRGNN